MIKLAQALLLRSDHTTRIESLRSRITANALVQDGDKPDENPQQLLEEALALVARQEELIVAIQATNASHLLADGRTQRNRPLQLPGNHMEIGHQRGRAAKVG